MTARTRTHFAPVLRVIHWGMAILVLTMLFIGVGMVSTTGRPYVTLLALHRPVGIGILVLAVLRLAIRVKTGAPPLPLDLPAPQRFAAKASHVFLYAAMIGMPLIGWGMLSAGGYRIALSSSVALPPILSHNLPLYAFLRTSHTVIALAFFALILLHLAAALMHGLIRRDGVLQSMTFGDARHDRTTVDGPDHAAQPADEPIAEI